VEEITVTEDGATSRSELLITEFRYRSVGPWTTDPIFFKAFFNVQQTPKNKSFRTFFDHKTKNRIPDLRSRIQIKEFKNFNTKNPNNGFEAHSGSRIRMLTFYPSEIPDSGVNKGSGSRIRNRSTARNSFISKSDRELHTSP
jgi:hypothetical protein